MQSRSYCFTLFQYDSPESIEEEMRNWPHIRCAVFQVESSPTTSRHHIQGYVEFTKPVRVNRLKTGSFVTAHYEKRRGTRAQAIVYCEKEESRVSGPYYIGNFRLEPGKRNDLLECKEALDAGVDERTLAESHFGAWVRYRKSFAEYRSLRSPQRSWKTRVIIYWGVAGAGKTMSVYRESGGPGGTDGVYDVPRPNGGSVWFDGFDPSRDSVVLLDDFYGWIPLHLLLKLGDRYPLRVPVKGGMVNFNPKKLYITSNSHWLDWYKWDSFDHNLQVAFERRIDEIKEFTEEDILNISIE